MRRHPLISATFRQNGKKVRKFFPGPTFAIRRYSSLAESNMQIQALLLADLGQIVIGLSNDIARITNYGMRMDAQIQQLQVSADSLNYTPQLQPVVH